MKKDKKKVFLYLLCLSLVVVLVLVGGCAGQQEEEEEEPEEIELRVAMDRPPGSFDTVLLEQWAENFNDRSEAAGSPYRMKVYPGEALCSMDESVDMVRTGGVDLAFFDLQYLAGIDDRFGAIGLPFVLDNVEQLDEFSGIIRDSLFNDIMEEDFDQIMLVCQGQDYHFYCGNVQIETLEDWEGLIMQVSSPMEFSAMEALNAAPTLMSFMDVVPSLQTGAIDGAVGWNVAAVYLLNAYDVVNYATVMPLSGIFCTVTMNLDRFNEMPAEIQQIMLEEAANFRADIFAAFQDLMDASYQACEDNGIEIYYLPSEELELWREAIASVLDDFYAGLDSGDAQKIQDAIEEAGGM